MGKYFLEVSGNKYGCFSHVVIAKDINLLFLGI